MLIRCPHCQKTNRIPMQRIKEGPLCGACGQSFLAGVIAMDAATLEQAIEFSTLPLLVDFWAPWCAPCRSFAPTFAAAAAKHGGKLIFAKLNTEDEPAVATEHNIRSIPTLAVFHEGQERGRVSGALPAAQLEQLIQQVLTQIPASH